MRRPLALLGSTLALCLGMVSPAAGDGPSMSVSVTLTGVVNGIGGAHLDTEWVGGPRPPTLIALFGGVERRLLPR